MRMMKRRERRSANYRGDHAATSPASLTPVNYYLIFWPWNRCKQESFPVTRTNDRCEEEGGDFEQAGKDRFKYQQGGTNEGEAMVLSQALSERVRTGDRARAGDAKSNIWVKWSYEVKCSMLAVAIATPITAKL